MCHNIEVNILEERFCTRMKKSVSVFLASILMMQSSQVWAMLPHGESPGIEEKQLQNSIYDFKIKKRNGEEISMGDYRGKVLIIVNTATGCGFTPQYEGLEKLYEDYHNKGLEILDFPCDQFGHQAPGSDDEIHSFCTAKYNTKFDQFAKIDVNGENESPLYTYLKEAQPEEEIKSITSRIAIRAVRAMSKTCKKKGDIVWNFTKFLVDRNGEVVKRYDSTFEPKNMEEDILKLL